MSLLLAFSPHFIYGARAVGFDLARECMARVPGRAGRGGKNAASRRKRDGMAWVKSMAKSNGAEEVWCWGQLNSKIHFTRYSVTSVHSKDTTQQGNKCVCSLQALIPAPARPALPASLLHLIASRSASCAWNRCSVPKNRGGEPNKGHKRRTDGSQGGPCLNKGTLCQCHRLSCFSKFPDSQLGAMQRFPRR